jgi:hypothetical protein
MIFALRCSITELDTSAQYLSSHLYIRFVRMKLDSKLVQKMEYSVNVESYSDIGS